MFVKRQHINNDKNNAIKFIHINSISLLMTSAISLPKNRIHPLNLTSQAVHQILKQSPGKKTNENKNYPTVKYTTEGVRTNTQVNMDIQKKIKQMDRIYSQSKKVRLKSQILYPEVSQRKIKLQSTEKLSKRQAKLPFEERVMFSKQQQNNSKNSQAQFSVQKNSSESYFNKINKIKSLKLKQYMKNKFAIEIKTIETTRQDISKKYDTNQNNMQTEQDTNKKDRVKLPKSSHNLNKSKNRIMNKKQLKENGNNSNSYDFMNQTDLNERAVTQQPQNIFQRQVFILGRTQKTQKAQYRSNKKSNQKSILNQKNFTLSKNFCQQNPVDIRFTKQKNQTNLILNSFGCVMSTQLNPLPAYSRNCFKYKYFVGPGNNRNLIISIMKKRWWWTQANSINDANLVWTQIKQLKILEQCKKMGKKSIASSSLKSLQKSLINLPNNIKKQKCHDQQYLNNNKIFHSKSLIRYDQNKIQIQTKRNLKMIQTPKKLHNHYYQNSMIGNKKALFYHISSYCQYKKLNRYDYIPLTFHITDQKSSEVKSLEKAFTQYPGSYWILKPGENTNRGNGISITKSISQIRQKIKGLSKKTLIVQKYIDNLFLYNSRKFDIRTYMIAVTIGGSTKFFWHNQGYIRTSSYTFNLKNYDDVFIHLTNDAIQCQSEHYSKYEQGNKLSYQQFQRYLDTNYNRKYSIKSAHYQMRNIVKLAVEAVYPQINKSGLQYTFQLFGLDFILDDNFRPWIIQVNSNPCLQLCAPSLHRLIPQVIENTFRIAVDTIFQPCSEFPRTMSSCVTDNIISTNRFQLIFDDMYDRDLQWEKRILQKEIQIQQEDQELHQDDGQVLYNL